MKPRYGLCMFFMIIAAMLMAQPARADGIIIPEPPVCPGGRCPVVPCLVHPCPPVPHIAQLSIRHHRVTVTIQDQVAVTRVDQVFYNPNDWQVEGEYVFPIPKDAAISAFSLWIDGEPVQGEVLEAEHARQIYEDIVRRVNDPALLEYADRGAWRARIFPIPPQGERRIELEYTQALPAENQLVRYTYPLNTEKFSATPLEQVSIQVVVRSSQAPIRAIYSPSHTVAINRSGDFQATASFEAAQTRPDTDFSLYYSLGQEQAFHLLTFRDQGDPLDDDGYFLLLLAASPEAASRAAAKDVILVLDRSGSMEGEKFQQAQQSLRYVLQHLGEADRFNVITFSSELGQFASRLQSVESVPDALEWVDRLAPAGSTDINRALLEAAALADPERPTYLIFLTDGLPTVGETDSQAILRNLSLNAPKSLRLFSFGVGYDVDTFLLDSLSQEHHGLSTYVRPGERLDEALSAFYARISTPVMTDLELDFGEIPVYDLYPDPLPDMFAGTQIVLLGRYRRSGETTLTLSGRIGDEDQTIRYPNQFFTDQSRMGASDSLAAIPRLWATRKIGYLLNQIRLNGADPETIDQIVRLSIRYGIITPYTSYLVTEDAPLGAAERQRVVEEEYRQYQQAPAPSVSGEAAVQKAADQAQLAQAESLQSSETQAIDLVRIIGSKTFVFKGETWIDTAFDPELARPVQIKFLSDAYFELAQLRADAAAALALGPRIILVLGDITYEIVQEGGLEQSGDLPETLPLETQEPGLLTTDIPAASQSTQQALQPQETPTPANTNAQPCASAMLLPLAGLVIVWIRFSRSPRKHSF